MIKFLLVRDWAIAKNNRTFEGWFYHEYELQTNLVLEVEYKVYEKALCTEFRS